MKKRRIVFIAAVLLISALLTACGSNEKYHNISAQNNVYSMGAQSVLIEGNSLGSDQPVVKFKQSIAPSDIELGEALDGKTVTKVTYNSESSITVELSGNTKVAGGADVLGSITVKHSGLESKGDSTCVVNVRAPEIKVSSMMSSKRAKDGVATYNIVATLSLPAGKFTENAVTENISLADGATGDLSVELAGDILNVTVDNCNVANPSLDLESEVTTFGKEITVVLSMGGSAEIK